MAPKILVIDSEPERARSLADALKGAGFDEVVHCEADAELIATVKRVAPDLVVIDMALPDRDALESVRSISAAAPKPIVMFADGDDPDLVEAAISAGVCSYNLSGVSTRDMRAIVTSAIALFRRYARVETELAAAQAQLEERRVIERAKAALMGKRKLSEPQSYRWLRTKAMNENKKIGQVAAELLKGDDADALLKS